VGGRCAAAAGCTAPWCCTWPRTLPPAEENEVLLAVLEAGVAGDVIGARSREVSGRAVEELLAGYLRAGFRHEFAQLLRREAARKPTGHAALLL
jgi:hypothetical protein